MNPDHHPKLNPVRAFQALHGYGVEAEADTSLSEYHDYEPSLEFDDSELVLGGLAPLPPELLDVQDMYLQRSASDGTIEENFEEELATAPESYAEIAGSSQDDEWIAELAASGLVEVVGDDELGRRVIVISACRLPPSKDLHHDKLLQYLMMTMDKYVEQDYSVVYFHYGLTSKNKPPMSWLWKAYKAFDRKYKKNLKALYLVHPTNFIRIVWQMLRPAISVKFGRKMMYMNYLHELKDHLWLDQLCIPEPVKEHDKFLLSKNRRAAEMASLAVQGTSPRRPVDMCLPSPLRRARLDNPPAMHQFGVSLEFIRLNNPGMVDSIPPIVRYCVEYLSQPDALETEGIFRRSTTVNTLTRMVHECNSGQIVDFRGDPHCAAVLLKHFLRDLDDPILTHQLYDEIIQFPSWTMAQRPRLVKILLLEKLPIENYKLLKYIVKFLWQVADRSCLNKMTHSNLAVVFGPNFLWPPFGQVSLQSIMPINQFSEFILENQEEIFII